MIDASLNDLSVPAERKNFREDRQKLVFSSEKSLVRVTTNMSQSHH